MDQLLLLQNYFPSDRYNIIEVTNRDDALNMVHSKLSCCWANGVITHIPDYVCLSIQSPIHKGDKQPVFVCKTELVADELD
jgi:hypothetical protein